MEQYSIQKCQARLTSELHIGTATNGAKMSKIKGDTEITTEYVNNKLEQVLSALFDTLEHTNDRMRKIEEQVHLLSKEMRDGK